MEFLTYALILACLVFVVLPPKWDLAIRWKERNERRRAERDRR